MKFKLMLTRQAKAYSSSCSQTVRLFSAISLQFILEMCAATKDQKMNKNHLILKFCFF